MVKIAWGRWAFWSSISELVINQGSIIFIGFLSRWFWIWFDGWIDTIRRGII